MRQRHRDIHAPVRGASARGDSADWDRAGFGYARARGDRDESVLYRCGTAEELPVADRAARAVLVATAAHWFDRPFLLSGSEAALPSGGILKGSTTSKRFNSRSRFCWACLNSQGLRSHLPMPEGQSKIRAHGDGSDGRDHGPRPGRWRRQSALWLPVPGVAGDAHLKRVSVRQSSAALTPRHRAAC